MKLSSKQIKGLQDISRLDLENTNPHGNIARMSLLLNILAGLRGLLMQGIKLPLSQPEKESLVSELKNLGHDYYLDLSNKTSDFYSKLSSRRERRYDDYLLMSGKSRYTFVSPMRYVFEDVAQHSNDYLPQFTILQCDDDEQMVKCKIRFYYFAMDKNGYDAKNSGYIEHTFWFISEVVAFALKGILYNSTNPLARKELEKVAKKNSEGFDPELLDDPTYHLIEKHLNQFVGSTFTLADFDQVEDFDYLFNRVVSDGIPAEILEKRPQSYYDFSTVLFDQSGKKIDVLPIDTTLIVNTPYATDDFLTIFENQDIPANINKAFGNCTVGRVDPDKNLTVLFTYINSRDSYNFDNLSTASLFTLSALSKSEYEKGAVIMTVLQLNSLLDAKIDLKNVHAKDIFRLIYLQQQELDYTVKNSDNNVPADQQMDELKKDCSKAFLEFIDNFGLDLDDLAKLNITVKRLNDYLNDLLAGRPIDNEIFNLIAGSASSKLGDNAVIALKQAQQLGINQKLVEVDPNIKSDLLFQFPVEIRNKITNVFKIKDDTDLSKYPHISRNLVHGTKSGSVFSILHQGLLDHETLVRQQNKHYDYTGSGLGNGIYFARINQSQKSVSYASTNTSFAPVYLFVCDVGYNKVYTAHDYGNYSLHGDHNLLLGKHVGSHGRDEIVAKNGKQVKMKYLIEFDKYGKN